MDAKEWYQDRKEEIDQDQVRYGMPSRILNLPHVNHVKKELFKFINNQNRPNHDIVVFCDYDADGVASGTVAVKCLKLAGMNVNKIHIISDDRIKGFGFNNLYSNEILEKFPETGMIITTDNGTASFPEAENLALNDIKLIITDHHPQSAENYNEMQTPTYDYNYDLVNPKEYNSQYPFIGFSGTGTVWKLFQSYFYDEYLKNGNTNEFEHRMNEFQKLIPYVAMSVVSDVMPMKDENRAFVKKGFNMINNNKAGLLWKLLKDRFGKKEYGKNNIPIINENVIGWTLGPVLNADSRIHLAPTIALFLFLPEKREELLETNSNLAVILKDYISPDGVDSDATTKNVLDFMIKNNKLRQNIVDDVLMTLQSDSTLANSYVLELTESMLKTETIKEYRKATNRQNVTLSSIAGIVASRISNEYHHPSIVIAEEKDAIHKDEHPDSTMYLGSARSESFDLLQLNDISPAIHIHGHDHAAGASIITDNLPAVMEFLNKEIDKFPQTIFDNTKYLSPDNVDVDTLNKMNNLGPFGEEFLRPTFRFIIKLDNNSVYNLNRFTTREGKTHLKITKPNNDTEVMIWNTNKNPNLTKMLDEYEEFNKPFQISFAVPMTVATYQNREFCQAATNATRVHLKELN